MPQFSAPTKIQATSDNQAQTVSSSQPVYQADKRQVQVAIHRHRTRHFDPQHYKLIPRHTATQDARVAAIQSETR